MKKLLFITIVILCSKAHGQEFKLPYVDGKINYTEIVTLDTSFKKDALFISAKKFFVDVFKSGKDVIQMEDKEAGIVIGKGYTIVNYKHSFLYTYRTKIWHTVNISIKDGKYKFEITNMTYEYYVSPDKYTSGGNIHGELERFPKHNLERTMKEVDTEINDEIARLKIYMGKKQSTSDF